MGRIIIKILRVHIRLVGGGGHVPASSVIDMLLVLFLFLCLVTTGYCQFESSTGIPVCAANCSFAAFSAIGCVVGDITTEVFLESLG